jgi:penicillin-binding protein 1A
VWYGFFNRVIKEKARIAEENGEEFVIDEAFEVPPNLSFAEIDSKTGLLASPVCLFTLREVFLPGTEPDRFCTHEDHMMILDYYSVRR